MEDIRNSVVKNLNIIYILTPPPGRLINYAIDPLANLHFCISRKRLPQRLCQHLHLFYPPVSIIIQTHNQQEIKLLLLLLELA